VTTKIQKYSIHGSQYDDTGPWTWWARVPYGTFRQFPSWKEAAEYLRLRHHLRTNDRKK
jgi:hypothetical protein